MQHIFTTVRASMKPLILLSAQTFLSVIIFTSLQLPLTTLFTRAVVAATTTALCSCLPLHASGLSLEMLPLSSAHNILILCEHNFRWRVPFLLQCLASYCQSHALHETAEGGFDVLQTD